jgi:hypothetical protein
MKYPAIVFLAAALSIAAMVGQSVAANGYVNVGGGWTTGGLFFPSPNSGAAFTEGAAGGEVVIAQTVGLGGELGIVKRHSSFGFVSLDASFHLLRHAATGKVDPFITGGYTKTYNGFSGANGANFGAGLNYWLRHRFGVRAEFRDMVFTAGVPTTNFWTIRGGIVFR